MNIPRLLAALLASGVLMLVSSGCLCVSLVEMPGRYAKKFSGETVWVNDAGDVAVSGTLVKTGRCPTYRRELGSHYVLIPAEAVETHLSPCHSTKAGLEQYTLDGVARERFSPVRTPFRLQPVVRSAPHETPGPPVPLRRGRWHEAPGDIPYTLRGRPVLISSVWIRTGQEEEQTEWWAVPIRLLVFPAFAVDVATFPIQAVIVLHGLGNIR